MLFIKVMLLSKVCTFFNSCASRNFALSFSKSRIFPNLASCQDCVLYQNRALLLLKSCTFSESCEFSKLHALSKRCAPFIKVLLFSETCIDGQNMCKKLVRKFIKKFTAHKSQLIWRTNLHMIRQYYSAYVI